MSSESGTGSAFADALDDLKRRGCNLLVVGPPAERARSALCHRLLGDATAAPRRRLFVKADGTVSCLDDCDGRITPATARIVSRSTPTRSTAAPTETAGVTGPAHRRIEDEQLAKLAVAINEEIGAFATHAGCFDPGELRLCVDSLTTIVAAHEPLAVRRFIHAVTARVRSCQGMGHYHLAAERRDDVVVTLAPAFEAVVEVRIDDHDHPQQRWHLPDRDLHSDWLPV